ncbi:MAG: nicotinamide mononucleotide transporter [Clostridia bacterium]|nr:nicotinamide mononucleotide transporter [Clostridia bacterium]
MKNKLNYFIKNELSGWKTWEVVWLLIATLVIVALSIYWHDTPMGIISSTTGVICVVLTGKGKLSAYIFGLVNSILYAIIAYNAAYYGETMLNALYYVPMQFIGFYVWSKHINRQTQEVYKQHMKWVGKISLLVIIIVATIGYGLLLKYMGDAMPFVDSFTTVSSVVAMIISVRMFSEQWWIWVAVNVFSVYMWTVDFAKGSENIATLLMWIVYLGNSVIMLVKWEKEIRNSEGKENEV